MTLSKIFGRAVATVLVALTISFTSVDIAANIPGKWVQHPAACLRTASKYGQVDRIIDGERYVYFSIRGAAFNRNDAMLYTSAVPHYNPQVKDMDNNGLDKDPLQLFRFDKTGSWGEGSIISVAQDFQLSGAFHNILEYSPAYGVLLVVYENQMIDLIYDDGTFISSPALANSTVPARQFESYSITFDPYEPLAYIAGSYGVISINLQNGELQKKIEIDQPVAWAGRVGDNMVIFAGSVSVENYKTSAYVFKANEQHPVLNSPITGGENLQVLMPLSSNTFAAMAPGSSDSQNIVRVFKIGENGSVTYSDLTSVATVDNSSNQYNRHRFRTDGYVNPTKDGYSVFNNSSIYIIKRGIDFENPEDFKSKALETISKNGLDKTDEKNAKAASYDGKKFWFYNYESPGLDESLRGFYSRNYSGSWGESSAIVAPNAPYNGFSRYMVWHPKKGMLFRGPGSFFDDGSSEKDFFFSYKNGVWTDLTYAANNKTYSEACRAGRFLAIDPVYDNWVWSCPPRVGVLRMDLSDNKSYLALGSKTSNFNSWPNTYPGFYQVFEYYSYPSYPTREVFNYLVNFSTVDFDTQGNMWFARYYPLNGDDVDYIYQEAQNTKTALYYITPEERSNLNDASVRESIEKRKIWIEGVDLQQNSNLVALKKTKNVIIFSSQFYISRYIHPVLYDHNGTLDDTSDDRIVHIRDLYDELGERLTIQYYTGLYEDEASGDIWICTDSGIFIVNAEDLLNGQKNCRRLHVNKKFGVAADDYPFEFKPVNSVDKDNIGRFWIGTDMGLYCLSADGEELLGIYDIANSSLPSNSVLGVGCDQETGSVFVVTTRGIAEFQPDGSLVSKSATDHLTIWPSSLTPDYKGYINISGAETGSDYFIFDADGKQIVSLGKPLDGCIQWDGRNSNGEKVGAGRYNVRRSNVDETNIVIVLDK